MNTDINDRVHRQVRMGDKMYCKMHDTSRNLCRYQRSDSSSSSSCDSSIVEDYDGHKYRRKARTNANDVDELLDNSLPFRGEIRPKRKTSWHKQLKPEKSPKPPLRLPQWCRTFGEETETAGENRYRRDEIFHSDWTQGRIQEIRRMLLFKPYAFPIGNELLDITASHSNSVGRHQISRESPKNNIHASRPMYDWHLIVEESERLKKIDRRQKQQLLQEKWNQQLEEEERAFEDARKRLELDEINRRNMWLKFGTEQAEERQRQIQLQIHKKELEKDWVRRAEEAQRLRQKEFRHMLHIPTKKDRETEGGNVSPVEPRIRRDDRRSEKQIKDKKLDTEQVLRPRMRQIEAIFPPLGGCVGSGLTSRPLGLNWTTNELSNRPSAPLPDYRRRYALKPTVLAEPWSCSAWDV